MRPSSFSVAASRLPLCASVDLVRRLQHDIDSLAPAHIVRWRPDSSIGFNVLDVRPNHVSTGRAIIYPMSFDYRIDSLIARRLQILAAVAGARVIGVEIPGVTIDTDAPARTPGSRVPLVAVWRAFRGDYRPLAQLQIEAIRDTTGLDLAGSRLIGESLGAQLTSTMAGLLPVRSLDLIEPTNARRRRLVDMVTLARALGEIEHDRRVAAIAESARLGWDGVKAFEDSSPENAITDRRLKRFRNQGRWALASATGLRYPLSVTLSRAAPDVPITLWHAKDSAVTRASEINALAEALCEQGHSVEIVTMTAPGGVAGHHVLTNLTRMTSFAGALLAKWGGAA